MSDITMAQIADYVRDTYIDADVPHLDYTPDDADDPRVPIIEFYEDFDTLEVGPLMAGGQEPAVLGWWIRRLAPDRWIWVVCPQLCGVVSSHSEATQMAMEHAI